MTASPAPAGFQVSFKRKERGTEETEEEGDDDGEENENRSKNLAGTITSSEGGAKFTSANPGKFVFPFYSPLYSYGLINGTGSVPGILPAVDGRRQRAEPRNALRAVPRRRPIGIPPDLRPIP